MAVELNKSNQFPWIVLGNPSGAPLVFLAGFPDDCVSAYAKLIDALKENHLIIALCLPQYENGATVKPWGYDFDQLLTMMDNTISAVCPSQQFTLVVHDWGAFMGYLYQEKYPHKVTKMISFDIGIMKKMSIKTTLLVLLYQWWFAWSYIVAHTIHMSVGQVIFMLYFILVKAVKCLRISHDKKVPRPQGEISVNMCYPYYHFWKAFFKGKEIKTKFPSCPLYYMYGTKKAVMFHDDKFLQMIEERPKCRVKSFDCGHWLMNEFPDEIAGEIEDFINN